MSKKVDEHLKEALDNIREDRKITRELLDDAMRYLAVDQSRHRDMGLTLAKYVETLQRSNEQLGKVSTIIHKQQGAETGLTADDKAELFDLLQGNGEEDS